MELAVAEPGVAAVVTTKNGQPRTSDHFSQEQIAMFRAKLLAEKDKAQGIINSTRNSLRESAENRDRTYSDHFADMGSDSLSREQGHLSIARQTKLIGAINRALTRLNNDTFGFCLETGELICLGRLEARPWTTRSIEAKRQHNAA